MEETICPPLPRTIYLETSSRCNLKCTTCSLTYAPREAGKELSWAEFRQIIDQFPTIERVVLHGVGEPLLNRELHHMIAYCKTRGAHVLFNSNGILLRPERQRALIDAGLDEIRISLDSATPQTYQQVRGAPAFEQIIENLRHLAQQKATLHVRDPRVALWMTGMKVNIAELPALIRLAAEVAAEEVNLQRLVFFGKGLAVEEESIWLHPTPEEDQILTDAKRLAAELGVRFVASGNRSAEQYMAHQGTGEQPWSACWRPWNLTYITAHGNVLPCCFAPWIAPDYADVTFGNVLVQDFGQIWAGERYQAFRTALKSPAPHPCCKGCGLKWSL